MSESGAFAFTITLFVLGVGALLLRDYFESAEARELWYRRLAPVGRFIVWSMSIFLLIVLLAAITLPMLDRPRGHRRNPTAFQMNMLAKAMYMYSEDNGGKFPSGRMTP